MTEKSYYQKLLIIKHISTTKNRQQNFPDIFFFGTILFLRQGRLILIALLIFLLKK